jgi:tetratricopeptide (TPR) repeat protein
MGRLDEARREFERAAELARTLGALENLGFALSDWAVLEAVRGDVRAGLEHASRAFELAVRVGTAFSRLIASHRLAEVQNAGGRHAEAAEALEAALAVVRASRVGGAYEGQFLTSLSDARLGLGEAARARAAAEEAVAVVERQGTRIHAIGAHLALARALLRTEGVGARAAVEHALDRSARLVTETGARRWQPLVHLARAELARLAGDDAARRHELGRAHRLFTEMGATARAEQVARDFT